MNILVIGAGGVGAAFARIAQRRDFFDRIILADIDVARATSVVDSLGEPDRFDAAYVSATDEASMTALIRALRADAVLNAVDPRFNLNVLGACLKAGAAYLDMASTLSVPHTTDPFTKCGVKLADMQFDRDDEWRQADLLALVGMGVEPGFSDVAARYAADHLFASIDEISVRDGANLVVEGHQFAPTFSIWTTIEECLNPALIWERGRGWYTTEPLSDPELFEFPDGIGVLECVNVEHEEVALIPRVIDCRRVTFKYGLGADFVAVLKWLHELGLDSKEKIRVGDVEVAPRDVVAKCLPDPGSLGERMTGKTCAGTLVSGIGKDGNPRSTYIYHVADNEVTMREYGCQAVVWQTAINPVVALELLARGDWKGTGVLGPESFDPVPFLDLLVDYGSPYAMSERAAAGGIAEERATQL
jgi:saccharopine dehydrogenase-like NADP-dependent oxidoreductase